MQGLADSSKTALYMINSFDGSLSDLFEIFSRARIERGRSILLLGYGFYLFIERVRRAELWFASFWGKHSCHKQFSFRKLPSRKKTI